MMNLILRKLAAAMIAGFGFKLGADAYDALKSKIKERTASAGTSDAEAAGGAEAVDAVEASPPLVGEQDRRRPAGEPAAAEGGAQ